MYRVSQAAQLLYTVSKVVGSVSGFNSHFDSEIGTQCKQLVSCEGLFSAMHSTQSNIFKSFSLVIGFVMNQNEKIKIQL